MYSERLIIRTLKSEDISNDYISALNDKTINIYTEARHKKWTYENCLKFISLNNNSKDMMLFGVFLKIGEIHLGNVRILNISKIHKRAEISMFFYKKAYWNLGYSTEALKEVINYCFNNIGLRRISADYYETNYASKRVFEKLNFNIEGIFRDHFFCDGKFINSVRVALMKER